MAYTVAQNTSFLTAASILQKVISFFYFILIARIIGVENTGQYFFAITFTTIFSVMADFGFSSVLTREAARQAEKSGEYFNTVFWTKILFGIITYGLVVATANILGYPSFTKDLIYIAGITMFFDNMQSAFFSIFRANKNLKFESAAVVLQQFITLVIGTTALLLHWPIVWLIIAYTIPSFLANVYGAFFVRKYYQCNFKFSWNRKIFKMFIYLAIPFALAGILGRLYSYSDSLLMSKMLTVKELGWWSVPYKIAFAFQFIPVALSASVYPVFSSLYMTEKAAIGILFEKSWRYLFAIIFPLALGVITIADKFILQVYGNAYAPSVVPLRILMISLVFGYLAFITGALLNGTNKQKTQTGIVGAALIFNFALNLYLLPRLRLEGAAVSAMLSNFLMCAAGLYFSRQQVAINMKKIGLYFVQTLIPALVMSLAIYLILPYVSWMVAVPAAAVFYLLLLFAVGFLNMNMVAALKTKLSRK